MTTQKISSLSRFLLVIVSGLFFASLLFPMWQIELEAPQYPEGLILKLHANKIAGDVDIINGLNHYIGMATLHTENFVEFSILPYIIGFFGLFALVTMFLAKRKAVMLLFISLLIFTLLAGIDFYHWNYEYGHNLDPNAAIKVPGMAYQPPVLGYKQLLNFGAYSIPDIGGWMLIFSGVLIFLILFKEYNWIKKFKKSKAAVAIFVLSLGLFSSCGNTKPEPIVLNSDQCNFCKMSISDGRFGAEIITKKGRVYKFDDIVCMAHYVNENKADVGSFYIHDYANENQLISAETAYYIEGGDIASPMRGNIAAFESKMKMEAFQNKLKATSVNWETIIAK